MASMGIRRDSDRFLEIWKTQVSRLKKSMPDLKSFTNDLNKLV